MSFPQPYPNPLFSAFAFTGFVLCAIPFPWHREAWNTGTCLYMAWTGLACLNQFINSIVWNKNAINWAPVWCDISSKFIVGSAVAIPAASLCINRRLYHIASVRTVTVTKAEKRRAVMVDLAIGLGLPILEMVLHYIPQGHRFNIFEDVGCFPYTYPTWVAYALVSAPPIVIGLMSGVYATLSIISFNKSRAQFNELLSNHTNLTSSRYFRLMLLAGTEVCCTVPLGVFALYLNLHGNVTRPWKGWADTHSGFSRVDQFPALLWRSNSRDETSLELSRWLVIVCAFIFFGFFGFADEAKKSYRSAFTTVAKKIGISTGSFGSTSSVGFGSSNGAGYKGGSTGRVHPKVPVMVHKEMFRRHDSLDSFSNMSVSIADVGGLLDEKKEPSFSPTQSYGGITLNDVGGTLSDVKEDPYSPISPAGSSSASTLTSPEPAHLPLPSSRPPSFVGEVSLPVPKANTSDVV